MGASIQREISIKNKLKLQSDRHSESWSVSTTMHTTFNICDIFPDEFDVYLKTYHVEERRDGESQNNNNDVVYKGRSQELKQRSNLQDDIRVFLNRIEALQPWRVHLQAKRS